MHENYVCASFVEVLIFRYIIYYTACDLKASLLIKKTRDLKQNTHLSTDETNSETGWQIIIGNMQ